MGINSSESTQRKLSNEYQHNRVQKSFHPCAVDKSSHTIGRVNLYVRSTQEVHISFKSIQTPITEIL